MEKDEVYPTENGYFAKVVSVLKGFDGGEHPIKFPVFVHLYHDKECNRRWYGGPQCYTEKGLHGLMDMKQDGKNFTKEDVKFCNQYKLMV